MSLTTTHPIWAMAETPFEISKATTVANMLSGRYVTHHRARYWSTSNPEGHCQLCILSSHPLTPGTLEHLLLKCPVLAETRLNSIHHWSAYLTDKHTLLPILAHHTLSPGKEGDQLHVQFLLDPSTCPAVVLALQELGSGVLSHLLYLTRTWCHAQHLKRRRLLKLYNII